MTAFDSVVRLGSVTDAAAELDLTQGAVSRQIQKLEEQLDIRLFIRDRRRLVVTPAGRRYAETVHEVIATLHDATLALKSNPEGGLLELAILPAFGTHWLAPRLPDFLRHHPGVTVNLATRTEAFDFAQETFHAALHFGRDDWPGTRALKLMDEEVVAVVAPQLCPGGDLDLSRLAGLTHLQLQTRRTAWAQWYHRQGMQGRPPATLEFDQFATMLKAAEFGAGAALMPRYLVQGHLERGRLVTLPGAARTSLGAYYLVWPESLSDYPPVRALRDWIGAPPDPAA
ncbi:LysR family transcriptional regulator [Shimia sp.]|uniref:LysR family transcriptional regulator n=1 Tax=Shimia sp. TaxID=1954381 RepID=UPI003568918E